MGNPLEVKGLGVKWLLVSLFLESISKRGEYPEENEIEETKPKGTFLQTNSSGEIVMQTLFKATLLCSTIYRTLGIVKLIVLLHELLGNGVRNNWQDFKVADKNQTSNLF